MASHCYQQQQQQRALARSFAALRFAGIHTHVKRNMKAGRTKLELLACALLAPYLLNPERKAKVHEAFGERWKPPPATSAAPPTMITLCLWRSTRRCDPAELSNSLNLSLDRSRACRASAQKTPGYSLPSLRLREPRLVDRSIGPDLADRSLLSIARVTGCPSLLEPRRRRHTHVNMAASIRTPELCTTTSSRGTPSALLCRIKRRIAFLPFLPLASSREDLDPREHSLAEAGPCASAARP